MYVCVYVCVCGGGGVPLGRAADSRSLGPLRVIGVRDWGMLQSAALRAGSDWGMLQSAALRAGSEGVDWYVLHTGSH